MPYASKDEANPALLGIMPPLTLAQMNLIASWADAIGGDKSWPIAIAQFKDRYEPNDAKTGWRKKKRVEEGQVSKVLSLKEAQALAEAATLKSQAKRALRALKGILENKTTPKHISDLVSGLVAALNKKWADLENEADDEDEAKENYPDDASIFYPSMTALSFADLEAQKASQEYADNLRERTREFSALLSNVLYTPALEDAERADRVRGLVEEFIVVLALEPEEAGTDVAETAVLTERLAEADGTILGLSEADPVEWENDGAQPLMIEVVPIEPGWGNTRDNHHYGASMLKRDASLFEGVMMHASEHDDKTKSVLTGVSQIVKCPIRFLPSGAPVGLAAVYDRDFSYSVREREKAGKLGDLQCSILAEGEVQEGFTEGDRKGKDVLRLTMVRSVDWVMRAGAGGRALKLAESEEGVDGMAEKEKDEQEVVAEKTVTKTPQIEALHESEAPTSQTIMEAILSADLPKPVCLRLLRGHYATVAELQTALQEASVEVTAILAGQLQPKEDEEQGSAAFGLSTEDARQEESASTAPTEAQIAEAKKAVLAKYLPGI